MSTAKLLVEAGAPLNPQTKSGETPLHLSVEKGNVEFVKYLLEKGAAEDIKSESGATAFDIAKKAANKDLLLLLKPPAGANAGGGCCVMM